MKPTLVNGKKESRMARAIQWFHCIQESMFAATIAWVWPSCVYRVIANVTGNVGFNQF